MAIIIPPDAPVPPAAPKPAPEPWWRKAIAPFLPRPILHEVTTFIEGFTTQDAENFIAVVERLTPVVMQSEEVMNNKISEVQAAMDIYHMAGAEAVRKAAQ